MSALLIQSEKDESLNSRKRSRLIKIAQHLMGE
jgi:hypothetical protein